MSDPGLRQSPLIQVDLSALAESDSLQVIELPFRGHVNLRGRPSNEDFMQAVKKVLGVEPPLAANTFIESSDYRIHWLGPDEWLVVTPDGGQLDLEQKLRDALAGIFASVTDVSSGQTMLRIAGGRARDLLQKGCSLDLHPRVFKPGQCAQSLLAKAGVLLSMVDDQPTFDLVVRRSFSDYLGLWLLDAAEEFLP